MRLLITRLLTVLSVLVVLSALAGTAAHARLPEAYSAIVVSAPAAGQAAASGTPTTTEAVPRVFDLRPALEVAAKSGKPILLYFGAFDCPFCKQLDRLFAQYAGRLAPKLRDKFTVIEIDGWLRGAKMEFMLPEGRFTLPRLRERFGDHEPRFLWPTFYWLDSGLRIYRDIPPGIGVFREVESVELLFEL